MRIFGELYVVPLWITLESLRNEPRNRDIKPLFESIQEAHKHIDVVTSIIRLYSYGSSHCVYVIDDNTMYAFGSNKANQLGVDEGNVSCGFHRITYFRQKHIQIAQLHCGYNHTMVIDDQYNVYGFGSGASYINNSLSFSALPTLAFNIHTFLTQQLGGSLRMNLPTPIQLKIKCTAKEMIVWCGSDFNLFLLVGTYNHLKYPWSEVVVPINVYMRVVHSDNCQFKVNANEIIEDIICGFDCSIAITKPTTNSSNEFNVNVYLYLLLNMTQHVLIVILKLQIISYYINTTCFDQKNIISSLGKIIENFFKKCVHENSYKVREQATMVFCTTSTVVQKIRTVAMLILPAPELV
ncbi:hypothetical protein RFI_17426 [Reticulomyxa filosa]|uniref:Uncharacterized protein n=1 Tax=Reticulomyxa filosa TaxID=46433 RepID=X6N1M4_RETFI|nr:hypothetical protein RFI_17426 [Reticulomyxa filosa]|eukprot:ETO19803.1 hypothetical protein RFI_17426 [Reticulomyxa filosa]